MMAALQLRPIVCGSRKVSRQRPRTSVQGIGQRELLVSVFGDEMAVHA